jgi:hypothetical protein
MLPVANGFHQVEAVSSQNIWLKYPCSLFQGFHCITLNNHIQARFIKNLTWKHTVVYSKYLTEGILKAVDLNTGPNKIIEIKVNTNITDLGSLKSNVK